jgi:predicted MFS family arabinose efflux permease
VPDTLPPTDTAVRLTPGLVLMFSAVAGAAVANIYYNQPVVSLIARSFALPGAAAAQVTAATQFGYAAGLLLLVPLGDVRDRRSLILWQVAALVAGMAAAALAPSLLALTVASLCIGAAATIAQQVIPIVAELAAPEGRGRAVGTVMSGLLGGILLARVLSGLVGAAAGWRAVFWFGTVLALAMALLLVRHLPAGLPYQPRPYGKLLMSLGTVWRQYPSLRRASLVQATLYGAFSAFWATLTLLLASPAFDLGPAVAGGFGVIGLVGVGVAPLAGRLADRRGVEGVITTGVLSALAGFAALGLVPGLTGLVLGTVLVDAGFTMAMISHQTVILALDDHARSRINTIFMTILFFAGAVGSVGGSLAWHNAGWPGVTLFGAALVLGGLALHRFAWRAP